MDRNVVSVGAMVCAVLVLALFGFLMSSLATPIKDATARVGVLEQHVLVLDDQCAALQLQCAELQRNVSGDYADAPVPTPAVGSESKMLGGPPQR